MPSDPEMPSAPEMSSAPPLSPQVRAALESFARHEAILVATDFDGVLAPLVLNPLAAQALPGSIEALCAIAEHGRAHVAVVSGRDLDTLAALTGLGLGGPITLIGSHGAQRNGRPSALSEDQAALLAALTRDVLALCERLPGVRHEQKPTAIVVHTRGLAPDLARTATQAARDLGARPGVHVKAGKSVVELTVTSADKGSAVRELASECGAEAVLYLGDDATDEDVFAVLGGPDVGIKVGDGPSLARLRVADPNAVAAVLALLAALRLP